MTATKITFWKTWSWLHWVALALLLVVSVKEVYSRQLVRLHKLDKNQVEVIEEDIQEFNTMAERLTRLEVLPPVKKQWDFVPAIAYKYGVEINVLGTSERNKKSDMYNGPLMAWNAELKGDVIPVLVAANEIQRTVPVYLYQFSISKGMAKIGISVIGSE